MAGSKGAKKSRARVALCEDEPVVLEVEDQPGVTYVTIRIPFRHERGRPTVSTQTARWTPRQARAQRLVYDGLAFAGEKLSGVQTREIGTTAPLWHATAWILDAIATAAGMNPNTSRDTLA